MSEIFSKKHDNFRMKEMLKISRILGKLAIFLISDIKTEIEKHLKNRITLKMNYDRALC